MGLCQQHDILFDELTVEEHVRLICELKLMDKDQVRLRVEEVLEIVSLDKH